MASKSFLSSEETANALKVLNAPLKPNLREPFRLDEAYRTSEFCQGQLFKRLSEHPEWRKAHPVLLGSWSRNELSAKSDIDLLFLGPEETVASLVKKLQSEGLKIRARVPENINDWTAGVEAFDIVALFFARAGFPEDQDRVEEHKAALWDRGPKLRKALLKDILKERAEREKRYDSISNYLEPNIKYGPGGLRDLEQGLMMLDLFPNQGEGFSRARERLTSFKSFLLYIRHFLHLSGAQDVLVGDLQRELTDHLGYASVRALMSDVQFALSEVSFYADWVAEAVRRPKWKAPEIEDFHTALKTLEKDPSILTQGKVREAKFKTSDRKRAGLELARYLQPGVSEQFATALFRSRLLEKILPDLEKVSGLVQHDQYHRFSVDAHLLQAVRGVLRARKSPKHLGKMGVWARKLTATDWRLLLITALFHDLAKGREGDHSTEGAELARKRLTEFGMRPREITEVVWLVQNHLILSGAAFRRNPSSQALWAELFVRGVTGPRIARLGVFTVVDIIATNPEAWNEWKDRLLSELCQALGSPGAGQVNRLLERAGKAKIKIDRDFLEGLDSQVIARVSMPVLLDELRQLTRMKHNLLPRVVSGRGGLWVRFHSREDRPGLFLSFTKQLRTLGLNVVEAYVQTHPSLGAYDWFYVKSSRDAKVVQKWLAEAAALGAASAAPAAAVKAKPVAALAAEVKFDVIEVVARDQERVVLSFRGKDQSGALVAAAEALFAEGFLIESAKVHTWGRQIDDVFTVRNLPDLDQRVERLQQRLSVNAKYLGS